MNFIFSNGLLKTYGFGAGSKKSSASGAPLSGIAGGKSRSDVYNFDISNDELGFGKRDSGASAASKKREFAPRQTRRLSTADRADEILRNSINERKSVAREQPPDDAFSSFQESWKELMVGLETHSKETTPIQTPSGSPRFADKSSYDGHARTETSSPFDSPGGSESFEISAADLEVCYCNILSIFIQLFFYYSDYDMALVLFPLILFYRVFI